MLNKNLIASFYLGNNIFNFSPMCLFVFKKCGIQIAVRPMFRRKFIGSVRSDRYFNTLNGFHNKQAKLAVKNI